MDLWELYQFQKLSLKTSTLSLNTDIPSSVSQMYPFLPRPFKPTSPTQTSETPATIVSPKLVSAGRPPISIDPTPTPTPSSPTSCSTPSLPNPASLPSMTSSVSSSSDASLSLQMLQYGLSGSIPDQAKSNDPKIVKKKKTVRKEKLHLCDHPGCGYSFPTRFSLKRHQKRHTGEKPFYCTWVENGEQCGTKFAEKSTLKRHLQTHTGEKPFKCSRPGCDRVFADRLNCHRHERRHRSAWQPTS